MAFSEQSDTRLQNLDIERHNSPEWVQNRSYEMNYPREFDGFLDFKIFVRMSILELKLIIFPSIPNVTTIKKIVHLIGTGSIGQSRFHQSKTTPREEHD